jgi:hypothetical protein
LKDSRSYVTCFLGECNVLRFGCLGRRVVRALTFVVVGARRSFYFWCMIPAVENDVDGCPDSDVNITYMTLSAFIGLFLFVVYQSVNALVVASSSKKMASQKNRLMDAEFHDLQIELYGAGGAGRRINENYNSDTGSSTGAGDSSGHGEGAAKMFDDLDEMQA